MPRGVCHVEQQTFPSSPPPLFSYPYPNVFTMSAQQQPAAVARGKHAILLGATGAVGSSLLSALLASGAYGQIHAFVRKPFKERKGLASDERVVEHIVDFDKLIGDKPDVAESKKFRDIRADVVYIARESCFFGKQERKGAMHADG